eukprot:GILI01026815.1.p1 GENE.GILI01026815.1~~GILI01026815.1.p1  ORF type:complete len:226 (+),score=33.52 GILI01026815.1:48-680(+)
MDIPLFGGALFMSLPASRSDKPSVPLAFRDMSDFRQVPDHQEVHSDIDSGCVVIVELLGTADDTPNEKCAEYYFEDLAKCNECVMGSTALLTSSHDLSDADAPFFPNGPIPSAPCSTTYKCVAEGHQLISKFVNEQANPNEVYVGMVIVRLGAPVATDLVVSVSVPVKISPDSSEAKNVTPETIMSVEQAQQVLRHVAASLRVERWSLFV